MTDIRLAADFPGGGALHVPAGVTVTIPAATAAALVAGRQAVMVTPPGTVKLEAVYPGGGVVPLQAGETATVPDNLAAELIAAGVAQAAGPPPPAPVLSSLDPPTFALPPTGLVAVKAVGHNFTAASVVVFDGKPVSTTFTSPTELAFTVDLSAATANNFPVVVRNGAQESAPVDFVVT